MTDGGTRESVVLDTNVLVVAGGRNVGALEECEKACLAIVRSVHDGAALVAVDSDGRIPLEYARHLRALKGAGVGEKLAVALSRRYRDPTLCRLVDVTPIDDPPGSFKEVPEVLPDFDTDDQVFIAVAAADPTGPQIYTAVDGEYWDRKRDFVASGIGVQFPCSGAFLARGSSS